MTTPKPIRTSIIERGRDRGPELLQWYASNIWKHYLPREAIMLGRHRTALPPGVSVAVFAVRAEEMCQ